MIYLIHGDNIYESWRKTKDLMKKRIEKSKVSFKSIEAEELENNQLQFSSYSMFGELNDFVIKRFFSLAQEVQEKYLKEFETTQDMIFILWEDKKIDKRLKIFKKLEEKYDVFEYGSLKEYEMKKWIKSKLNELGIEDKTELIEVLIFKYRNDQYMIESELSKLKILMESQKRKKITEEDIDLLSPKEGIDVWDFVKYFFKKQKKKAIEFLERLVPENHEEIFILASIASQMRSLFIVKKFGQLADTFAKEVGIHPYSLKIAKEYSQNFSYERIKKLYEQLVNLDYAMKRNTIEARTGLGFLIASL